MRGKCETIFLSKKILGVQSIMISHHVILSHLHDILASHHSTVIKMLHTQCPENS